MPKIKFPKYGCQIVSDNSLSLFSSNLFLFGLNEFNINNVLIPLLIKHRKTEREEVVLSAAVLSGEYCGTTVFLADNN